MSPRVVALGVILFTALLLQTVVAPMIMIGSWPPDLVLATVVAFAVVDGPETGARYGFVAGLGADLLSGGDHLVGLMALVFLVVGEFVGRVRPYLSGTDQLAATALGAIAGVLAFGLFGGMAVLLDMRSFTVPFVLQGIVAGAAWTAVTAPLATFPVRAISRRFASPEAPAAGQSAPGRW